MYIDSFIDTDNEQNCDEKQERLRNDRFQKEEATKSENVENGSGKNEMEDIQDENEIQMEQTNEETIGEEDNESKKHIRLRKEVIKEIVTTGLLLILFSS